MPNAWKSWLPLVPHIGHLVAADYRVQLHPDAAVDLRRCVRIALNAGINVVVVAVFLVLRQTFLARHLEVRGQVPEYAADPNARRRLKHNAHGIVIESVSRARHPYTFSDMLTPSARLRIHAKQRARAVFACIPLVWRVLSHAYHNHVSVHKDIVEVVIHI